MSVLSLLACHASPCTSTRCCKRLSTPSFPFDAPRCPHTNTPGTISAPCSMLHAPRTGSANASARQLPSAIRAPCSQYPHNSALNLSRRKSIDLWGYTRISGCKALDLPSSGSWLTAHGSRLITSQARMLLQDREATGGHWPDLSADVQTARPGIRNTPGPAGSPG
jgi:hypothetical protein